MGKRIAQLDSLRGLAALTVVLYHLLLMRTVFDTTTPHNVVERLLMATPLRIIWDGHEAVILFFVLSGFVLSLPFYNGPVSYSAFVVKRICRIYIPYLAAISMALIVRASLTFGTVSGLSGYFNRQWTTPLTWGNVIDHLIMIGPQFNTDTLDSPMWSLIHEMRISLVFPLIIWAVRKLDWKINIALGLLLSAAGVGLHGVFHATYQPVYKTLPYILMFLVGAILAKHRHAIAQRLEKLNAAGKITLLSVGLLCYGTGNWLLLKHSMVLKALQDMETLLGAACVIVLALSWQAFSSFLLLRPIQFLGKISYSLYLFHIIVLFSLTYTLYGQVPLGVLWIMILSGSVLFSTATYYVIELPAIRLGRILTEGRPRIATASPVEGQL